MNPNELMVGDTIAASGMGEGVITGFSERGFPMVNNVTCAYLERTDGVRFDPYGVAPWNAAHPTQPAAQERQA